MCCWKCSTWGQIIWFVIRDYVILPRKLQSEGSQYVTALKCLNQTILFYLLPRKLYSPETEWRQTAKNARVEQSTKSNFIPMPLWFCFIQKILHSKYVILFSILAMGIIRDNCVVKLSLRAGIQLWTFLLMCPCCYRGICCRYAFPSSTLGLHALSIVNWSADFYQSRDCFLSVCKLLFVHSVS